MKIQIADSFLDLGKIKYQKARFSLQGERAFSLSILAINRCISKAFALKNTKNTQNNSMELILVSSAPSK
jgi:hypothetical protein